MKILHVINRTDHNGCATHLLQLNRFLDKQEFENVVLCLSDGVLTKQLEEINAHFTVLNRGSYSSFSIARRIKALAEYYEADLIHCHDKASANLSFLATSTLKIPFIYNIHCWSFSRPANVLKTKICKINERFLMNQATRNVLPSQVNLKEGKRQFSVPNAVVIPHGVDTAEFDPDRPSALSRRVYGIPENYTVVGFLARLCEQKDPLTLIRAAALALKEERKLHFMVVGDGELKEICLAETRRLGIENNVSFQDIDADVPYILKIFDIYCMPSRYEGLSIGLLEAMAMKKAIVTSPVNANLEVIADHTDGLLVSSGNPEDWKKAILELHRDPRLRADMGRQARMFVERYYDIRKSIKGHAALYRRIVVQPDKDLKKGQPEKVLYSIQ